MNVELAIYGKQYLSKRYEGDIEKSFYSLEAEQILQLKKAPLLTDKGALLG
jgi:hypothetical protein